MNFVEAAESRVQTRSMEAKSVDADAIFRVFTACANDPKTLLLDVRPQKEYKKVCMTVDLRSRRVMNIRRDISLPVWPAHVVQGHINQAFNPRLATNGKFLADYSQAQYSMPWSQDCWWVRHSNQSFSCSRLDCQSRHVTSMHPGTQTCR